eukprot:845891-Prymnesium_polylepis.1
MLQIDSAFSTSTYFGLMPLGQALGAVGISLTVVPDVTALCLALAVLTIFPASLALARTISARTHLVSSAYAEAGGLCAEAIGAMRTVASLGLEKATVASYDRVRCR